LVAFGKLGRYFGRRFLAAVATVFLTCAGLTALVDFFELTRRFGDRPEVSFFDISYLMSLRLPAFTEQILPFAVLIGAMIAYLTLSRRLELVIARGAGMSVWQFTAPTMVIALLIGVFAVTAYNPLSATLKEKANQFEASLAKDQRAGLLQSSADGIWVRQQSVDGQAILHAQATTNRGQTLTGVKVYSFDLGGQFIERIEALTGQLGDGTWILKNARVYGVGSEPQEYETFLLSTNLTPEQVRGKLASPDSLSFWDLPGAIEVTEKAGLKAQRYRLQYQALLARPLFLIAMVVIAASVSLRVFRLGGVGKMILAGVVSGFLLYVASKLGEELGEGGIVNPTVAAWFPAVFGALMGSLVLLHQEDG
jgi:lipopolysaccharide export system permease protein